MTEECTNERTETHACDLIGRQAERTAETAQNVSDSDLISRKAAIDAVMKHGKKIPTYAITCKMAIEQLPSAQTEPEKYEYHYDHTDCIWYRPEARNRCPATCAQYRDGWNDAMNYIFRDGKGYMPYRRNKQYGE